jgi:acyl-CoA dehydrogenase
VLCTLKRYESEGRQQADAPLMHWAIWDAMYKAQMAFDGVIANFPVRFIGALPAIARLPAGATPTSCRRTIGHQVAKSADRAVGARDRLTAECYLPKTEQRSRRRHRTGPAGDHRGRADRSQDSRRRKGRALRQSGANVRDLAHAPSNAGIVTAAEYEVLKRRNELRDIVIDVDDFGNRQRSGRMRATSPASQS